MGIAGVILARIGRMILKGNTLYWTAVYSLVFEHMGRQVAMLGKIYLQGPENISIGNHTTINQGCTFCGKGGIKIGADVLIGQNVNIMTSNYKYSSSIVPIRAQGQIYKKVIIDDGAWICAAAIILPGVKIGKRAIVGAGAVVTKDVAPFTIVAGNPAKVVKSMSK
ncbi:2,3,4,5-tetrahydropyridine-2,6-dicarboxylate N-acetyltransferase [uncultured archaeon]|nr:2,3,4,5-tetrahydropyridine-2,6-dicarboxylate N-acetyltransferase [uncultured archaeon]